MLNSIFISDLHGSVSRYEKLFTYIKNHKPDVLFLGGDLLSAGSGYYNGSINKRQNFLTEYFVKQFSKLKNELAENYPRVILILGNDDARINEQHILDGEEIGLWNYINQKSVQIEEFKIYGYNFVPPTPFQLKDWEKYDVSRYVDTGCISPEAGKRTVAVDKSEIKFSTIKDDLKKLYDGHTLDKSIFLFHSPPHKTKLDRAALDGKTIDHVSVDVNVGSIAIRRFIEKRQPMLTLHGHIHESSALTGCWQDKIGKTICFNAAILGSKLSIIKFNLNSIEHAERIVI
ncbi:MAG: hypothetical protein HND52_18315 [Ignavibacteriae bacterium]|nr:hypothetical protein [Ignavibacteriota bacterium]NOG99918.1 hypothetical protein [Ignavibacteriota bacterium]